MNTHIVVIGDTHLRAGHSRNLLRLEALERVVAEGELLDPLGAWLWLGDIFDARSSTEDRNVVLDFLKRMASRAPVLIPRGNHDELGDLRIFGELGTPWPVIVREHPDIIDVDLATGQKACVFLLPYLTEMDFVVAGVAPADIPAAARGQLEDLFEDAAQAFEAASRRNLWTLFAGHINVSGSQSSNGQPNVGHEIEVDAALLELLGDCPKVLGHIHLPQSIGGAFYAGSISANDWGEIEAKRYLVVHLNSEGQWRVESKPLCSPAMYHVEGDIAGSTFTYKVTRGPEGEAIDPPATWKGSDVRARVRFAKSEKQLLDLVKPEIFANFAECRKFTLELIAVPDRAVRAPEVASAVTLNDKVVAYSHATGQQLPDGITERVAMLEHLDGDALLQEVRGKVDELVTPAPAEQAVA